MIKTICLIGIILLIGNVISLPCTTNSQCRLQTCVNRQCVTKNTICDENTDCTSPNVCINGKCNGLSPLYGRCDANQNGDCAAGLVCSNKVCLLPSGATCTPSSQNPCSVAGEKCLTTGVCGALITLGNACGDSSDCATGLVCGSTISTSDVCVVPWRGQCNSNNDCDYTPTNFNDDSSQAEPQHMKCRSNGVCEYAANLRGSCIANRDCGVRDDINLVCSGSRCTFPQGSDCDSSVNYDDCEGGTKCLAFSDSCEPRGDIEDPCGESPSGEGLADTDCQPGLVCEPNRDSGSDYVCYAGEGSSCREQDDFDDCVDQAICFNNECIYPPWITRNDPSDEDFGDPHPAGVVNGNDLFLFHNKYMMSYDVPSNYWNLDHFATNTFRHQATASTSNKENGVYVIGGFSDAANTQLTSTVLFFNTKTRYFNSDSDLPDLPAPLAGVAATVVNNILYVFGGITNGPSPGTFQPVNTVYRIFLDDINPSWELIETLSTARSHFTALSLKDGRIFLGGGLLSYGGSFNDPVTDIIEIYDTTFGILFTPNLVLPIPRAAYAAGIINSRIYLAYGYDGCGLTATVDSIGKDENSNIGWEKGSSGPNPRFYPAFGVVDNKLYVSGGLPSGSLDLFVTERYDGTLDSSAVENCSGPNPACSCPP